MKTALILHGWPEEAEYFDPKKPAPSNDHWFPWIQRQLLLHGISTQTPEMPDAHKPNYEVWKKELERFDINEETILVGHSCGGGFLVRWLSEHDVRVGKVVLVAPWLDPNDPHMIDPDFFQFEIDPNLVSRTAGLTIMYSTDDYPDVLESLAFLKKNLKNVEFQEFTDKGHFVIDSLKTEEFPELLKNLI